MALDKTFQTRYVRREVTDPTTGPYITGANIVSTVESLVDGVNAEVDALLEADSAQNGNTLNLAGHLFGPTTQLPVAEVGPEEAIVPRLAVVEDSYIALSDLQTVVAASTDFADFQTRIAALGGV